MTSTLVAKWETKLERVREDRLLVLYERDNLTDDQLTGCCVWAEITADLRYYEKLDEFARAAIRKTLLDETAAQLLDQLGEPAEVLDQLSSWLELVERFDQYGPPVDERPPRELVNTSSHGANAPPVEARISSNIHAGRTSQQGP